MMQALSLLEKCPVIRAATYCMHREVSLSVLCELTQWQIQDSPKGGSYGILVRSKISNCTGILSSEGDSMKPTKSSLDPPLWHLHMCHSHYLPLSLPPLLPSIPQIKHTTYLDIHITYTAQWTMQSLSVLDTCFLQELYVWAKSEQYWSVIAVRYWRDVFAPNNPKW